MPNPWDADPEAYLAQMMGQPAPEPSPQETRNTLLRHLSALAGGSSARVNVEEAKQLPGWDQFAQRTQEAGLDPEDLVIARDRNIGNYEQGGFASNIGDWMDQSGVGDLITYGTLAVAGAGAATAFGGAAAGTTSGAASGSSTGTFAGQAAGASASGLSTVSVPASATMIPVTSGAGVVLPSAATAGATTLQAMPSLTASGMLSSPGFTLSNVGPEGLGTFTAASGATPAAGPGSVGAARVAGGRGTGMVSMPPASEVAGAAGDGGGFFSQAGSFIKEGIKEMSFTDKLLAASYGTQALATLFGPTQTELMEAEAKAAKKWRGAFYGMDAGGGGFTADELPGPRRRGGEQAGGPGGDQAGVQTRTAPSPQGNRDLIPTDPTGMAPAMGGRNRGPSRPGGPAPGGNQTGGMAGIRKLLNDSQAPTAGYDRLKLPEPGAMRQRG